LIWAVGRVAWESGGGAGEGGGGKGGCESGGGNGGSERAEEAKVAERAEEAKVALQPALKEETVEVGMAVATVAAVKERSAALRSQWSLTARRAGRRSGGEAMRAGALRRRGVMCNGV